MTDRAHPVQISSDVRLIELDAPARIEAELSRKLPKDARQAAHLVKQRLADGGARLQLRLASAYQDVADAWSAGITKIPAVIVDRRFVVYGEPDVARAVREVERYWGEHR